MNHCTQICAFHRTIVGTSSSAASEQIAENITEDITHISAEIKSAKAAGSSARAALEGCMAELIILTPFFRVTEDAIRFGGFLKFCFCLFVAGIHIRMIFLCKLSVCFFQCGIIGSAVYAKDLVVISFFCHIFHLSIQKSQRRRLTRLIRCLWQPSGL